MWFLFVIIFIFIIVFILIISNINKRLDKDEKQLNDIQKKLDEIKDFVLSKKFIYIPEKKIIPKDAIKDKEEQRGEQIENQKVKKELVTNLQQKANVIIKEKIKKEKIKNLFIENFGNKLIENWIGIMASIVLIIGVGILGVYAAKYFLPIYRFLLISGIAMALLITAIVLKKKGYWIKLSSLFRSSSGAIFLFACFGSGGIPGLNWLKDNQLFALILLCFGILVNLILAVIGNKQILASLHVTLSLVAISMAPPNEITLIIVFIISFYSIILTYKEKWEYQLLLSISCFFIYICYWRIQIPDITFIQRIYGISGISVVSISSLFIHYRKIYQSSKFDFKPLISHLFNWLYFGISIFIYSPGNIIWVSIPVFSGAIVIFILAHIAKKLNIKWLYITDILVAQLVAFISIILLFKWDVKVLPIISVMLFESVIFSIIIMIEKEKILYSIGILLQNILSIYLLILSFYLISYSEKNEMWQNSIILFVLLIMLIVFIIFEKKRHNLITGELSSRLEKFIKLNFKTLCLIIGVFPLAIYFSLLNKLPWIGYIDAEYIVLIPVLFLLFIRNRYQSNGMGISLAISIILINIFNLNNSYFKDFNAIQRFIHILPLLIISLAAVKYSCFENIKNEKKYYSWFGVYTLFINISFYSYFVFKPYSPLITSIVWLLFAIISFESAKVINISILHEKIGKYKLDLYLIQSCYALVIAFIVRHILVNLQCEKFIWIFKVRLLIEIFAIFVFIYLFFNQDLEKIKYKFYINIQPLFLELAILFSIFTIAVELKKIYHPVIWMIASIIFIIIGLNSKEKLSRLKFHSIFLFWLTAIHIPFTIARYITTEIKSFELDWFIACCAIFIQLIYLIIVHKSKGFKDISVPQSLKFIRLLSNKINKKLNLWVYYPLFISIALFLIWSFDKSILTLLLSLEAFSIFILSIILKENHFRYLSQIAILGCLGRLVFYDLAKANTLTKAIVCIGISLLMFGMNILYNKFKERFIKNEKD